MRNFQDSFKTRKKSFISVFSIFMTVALIMRIGIECDLESKNTSNLR